MLIRKQFSLNNKHIVRNCTSIRCKENEHSHRYVVEVILSSTGLDNGHMLMDFGLFKNTIGPFIKSFDNACTLWSKDKPEYIEYSKKENPRHIIMNSNPSAESISLYMFYIIDKILQNTVFNNNENRPHLHSIRVHETETGWAESFGSDMNWFKVTLDDIKFSDAIVNGWKSPTMWDDLVKGNNFINPFAEQQVIEVKDNSTQITLELV